MRQGSTHDALSRSTKLSTYGSPVKKELHLPMCFAFCLLFVYVPNFYLSQRTSKLYRFSTKYRHCHNCDELLLADMASLTREVVKNQKLSIMAGNNTEKGLNTSILHKLLLFCQARPLPRILCSLENIKTGIKNKIHLENVWKI